MERTPTGTPVGVDDPYEHAGGCDHLTGTGTCRYAFEFPGRDPTFASERRAEGYACPIVAAAETDPEFANCPHFRSTTDGTSCVRCGLEERRMATAGDRPLLEEHHLSYASADTDGDTIGHEITVSLCRWCHAKVHTSWARITDDVSPDPDALAEREGRRDRELQELAFETAAERYGRDGS